MISGLSTPVVARARPASPVSEAGAATPEESGISYGRRSHGFDSDALNAQEQLNAQTEAALVTSNVFALLHRVAMNLIQNIYRAA